MNLYWTKKQVLRVSPGAVKFLNGLTSNSFDKPRNAFLNIHGRIIATFDQLCFGEEEVWIVLEPQYVSLILEHADRYARLSKVSLDRIEKKVYFDLSDDQAVPSGAFVIPQKKGRLVISDAELPSPVSEEEFRLFRVEHDIPLQGIDYSDQFLLNISESDFVSFIKGCFLGQEPVSKVHHRSRPTWKLTVKSAAQCSEDEKSRLTSITIDPVTGGPKGFVFVAND